MSKVQIYRNEIVLAKASMLGSIEKDKKGI